MERVSLAYEGKVAVLKFNHPEVMNAVGQQMAAELLEAVLDVRNPASGARCLLLTGEGRGFCAGANLQDEARGRDKGGAGDMLRRTYHPLLVTLRELEMPLVTAVNGAAAGVGMSFAIMGDIVCASKSAYFLQAFARIGLVPDGGSTFLLPRLVGWGRAMELSLLADRLPAEQAHEWGLVNRLYDDNDALMSGAMDLARRLADGPKSLGARSAGCTGTPGRTRSRNSSIWKHGCRTARVPAETSRKGLPRFWRNGKPDSPGSSSEAA